MKKHQWKVKAFLYGLAAQLIKEHQKPPAPHAGCLCSLKATPANKRRKELAAARAQTIHKENAKEN